MQINFPMIRFQFPSDLKMAHLSENVENVERANIRAYAVWKYRPHKKPHDDAERGLTRQLSHPAYMHTPRLAVSHTHTYQNL